MVLARDPFGIKPLYVAQRAGILLFASELRALLATGLHEPRAVGAVVADARRGVHRGPYPRAWSLLILELWCRGVLERPTAASD